MGMKRRGMRMILALLAACSTSKGDDDRTAPRQTATADRLGALAFEVTGGSAEARRHFERGLLALHSFWYDEATRAFQAAIDADRTFSMAYWGLAMSMAKLLWGDDRVDRARAILADLPRPDLLTPRERAWVQAARQLFANDQGLANRRAFAAAMEQLHRTYPDDESATFLAAALLGTLYPGHPEEAKVRARAAGLASEVFDRNPKHPGAAHYLIHAYDTPQLAARALPAARVYATIAPEAFHARHMPAHIFARLGMWKEALTSCQAAWDASIAAARRAKLGPDHHDYHSLGWLVEMNFEIGRRSHADAALRSFVDAVRGGLTRENRLAYVQQVSSYLARTDEWERADELLAPLEAPPSDDPSASSPATPRAPAEAAPGPGSCTAHAPAARDSPYRLFEERAVLSVRARAAAAARDRSGTSRLVDRIAAVDRALHPFLVASQPPELVAMQEEVNAQGIRALIARARGDRRGLLQVLEEMKATDRGPAGEGVVGGRVRLEGIADTLLELGRTDEALVAYEQVLRDYPGRASAMLGAARAARRANKPQLANEWYRKLLDQWADAEEGTNGLAEARAAVATR